jgi:hypothetical protein
VKIYQYKSPIGRFLIQLQDDGRWGLWFKDNLLGSYHSAMSAADDVYTQTTGDDDWDTLEGVDVPTDIQEWEVLTQ